MAVPARQADEAGNGDDSYFDCEGGAQGGAGEDSNSDDDTDVKRLDNGSPVTSTGMPPFSTESGTSDDEAGAEDASNPGTGA